MARKITQVLRLSSEQLSPQYHYDYGMRAVKAILVAAGQLRQRMTENVSEAKITLRAIMDVNLPKFVHNDIQLFMGIVSDLFPGVEVPHGEYTALRRGIKNACAHYHYQPLPSFIDKCLQYVPACGL